jgi:hypothetical protein
MISESPEKFVINLSGRFFICSVSLDLMGLIL